jgi:hypothetical protein
MRRKLGEYSANTLIRVSVLRIEHHLLYWSVLISIPSLLLMTILFNMENLRFSERFLVHPFSPFLSGDFLKNLNTFPSSDK